MFSYLSRKGNKICWPPTKFWELSSKSCCGSCGLSNVRGRWTVPSHFTEEKTNKQTNCLLACLLHSSERTWGGVTPERPRFLQKARTDSEHLCQHAAALLCSEAQKGFLLTPTAWRLAKIRYMLISFLLLRTEVNRKWPSPKTRHKRLSRRECKVSSETDDC